MDVDESKPIVFKEHRDNYVDLLLKQKQNTIEDNFFSNKLKKDLTNEIKLCYSVYVIREDSLWE